MANAMTTGSVVTLERHPIYASNVAPANKVTTKVVESLKKLDSGGSIVRFAKTKKSLRLSVSGEWLNNDTARYAVLDVK